MRTVVAAIRSLAAYLGVSLYVAITAPVGMGLALTFRWKAVLYMLGHGGVTMGAGLAGIRTRVEGLNQVRSGQAVVFFANHPSNIEPRVLLHDLDPRRP